MPKEINKLDLLTLMSFLKGLGPLVGFFIMFHPGDADLTSLKCIPDIVFFYFLFYHPMCLKISKVNKWLKKMMNILDSQI